MNRTRAAPARRGRAMNPSNINIADEHGATALHFACAAGDTSAAESLLAMAGCNVNACDNEAWTPLHECAKAGHSALAEVLLRAGADATARGGGTQSVLALHVAAANGYHSMCEVLLGVHASGGDSGGDVDAPDASGATALHHACFSGSVSIVLLLLEAGARADARAGSGMSSLHYARYAQSPELDAVLRRAGAPPIEHAAAWAHSPLALLGFFGSYARLEPRVESRAGITTSLGGGTDDGDGGGTESGAAAALVATHEVWTYAYGGNGAAAANAVSMHVFQLPAAAAAVLALNDELAAEAAAVAAEGEGLRVSNAGGFHSAGTLFQREAPCLARLSAVLDSATASISADGAPMARRSKGGVPDAWANVSRKGHYNKLHDHVPAGWSGAYYVAVPGDDEADDGGGDGGGGAQGAGAAAHSGHFAMRFASTGGSASAGTEPACGDCSFATIAPRPGMLLLFPATLKHAVLPLCHGVRISISFNCSTSIAME